MLLRLKAVLRSICAQSEDVTAMNMNLYWWIGRRVIWQKITHVSRKHRYISVRQLGIVWHDKTNSSLDRRGGRLETHISGTSLPLFRRYCLLLLLQGFSFYTDS